MPRAGPMMREFTRTHFNGPDFQSLRGGDPGSVLKRKNGIRKFRFPKPTKCDDSTRVINVSLGGFGNRAWRAPNKRMRTPLAHSN